MDVDSGWDIEHDDHDRTRCLGASHTRCNRPSETASEIRLPRKRKTP